MADDTQRPDAGDFSDYREYLQAMVVYLKATQRGFSYRWFSKKAGFSSPNFLKQVAEGQRNLSDVSVERFAKGLGLSIHELGVFGALVRFNQAKTDEERRRHYRVLRRNKKRDPASQMEADQYDLYSNWYALIVKEMAALPGFSSAPDWLARRIFPRIRPQQSGRAVALLQRLKLWVRAGDAAPDDPGTAEDPDRITLAFPKMTTGPEVRSLGARNFHRAMLALAARSLDAFPTSRRNVTSLTVTLDRARYERACEIIGDLRRELLDASMDPPPDPADDPEVYQVMFALFPVTKRPTSKES